MLVNNCSCSAKSTSYEAPLFSLTLKLIGRLESVAARSTTLGSVGRLNYVPNGRYILRQQKKELNRPVTGRRNAAAADGATGKPGRSERAC